MSKKQKLPKLTLTFNEQKENWVLKNDSSNKTVKIFDTKAEATKGGVLKKVLGKKGGSVKIQKENGRFQEERTFPDKLDPASSVG